jgi:endonuclease G, mitochondrial
LKRYSGTGSQDIHVEKKFPLFDIGVFHISTHLGLMSNNCTKSRFFLNSFLWLITLTLGIIVGISSQRIPEIRAYTNEFIQPLERSSLFKQLSSKIRNAAETVYSTEYQPSAMHLTPQQSPLPGHPISSILIHRKDYSLAYDGHHRNPLWVYEHLTNENIKNVSHADYKEDESIPKHLRTTLADYRGQGLDRGHLASSSIRDSNTETLNEIYYLTNVCPLCPKLNRGYWEKLDKHVRDLTNDYQNVYVTTGPLYMPYNEKGGRFVKYRVIGPTDIAVPSHFFKILLLEDKRGQKEVVAYILPNHEIPLYTPLEKFQTTVEEVEKAAGLIFF